jgi:hypothetical protein
VGTWAPIEETIRHEDPVAILHDDHRSLLQDETCMNKRISRWATAVGQ